MNNQVFRKKSIERISSPEQLNDYVRVSSPGVWMVLLAVIILLVGICVWGFFGHLDTVLSTVGVCSDGKLVCYVAADDIAGIKADMKITVNGKEYTITSVSDKPALIDDSTSSYVLDTGHFNAGDSVYEVAADTELASGIYKATIITDSVPPISFVLN